MCSRIKSLITFVLLLVNSPAFSQEKVSTVPAEISGIMALDSWKCTEYAPNIDPKCRFRAIYYEPLKYEGMPWMEIEILEWWSYKVSSL